MVKAVVGANWGDEGKGKITDMLGEKADISFVFRAEQTRDIRSSMTMESLHFTHCRQEFFMITRQVLSEMGLHLIFLCSLGRFSPSLTEEFRRRRS